ncbi:DUF4913 domain-containing protein [Nocardia sp. NPDC051570]|uniref:DUF4913 domain-containing protein n=1 Tax=Nocardia sp. NPDC051570 TaxID=3364324 RepID=UPI003797BEA7
MSDNSTPTSSPGVNGHEAGLDLEALLQVSQTDLGELLTGAIRKAVGSRIDAAAKDIADGVVAQMLTDEVRAAMTETAIHETELALNPAPVPDLEDDTTEAAAEEEPQREPKYADVVEFVESYVIQMYRREVTARGSQRQLRWCPRWHAHGEVWARMEAMHQAFEHLRLGATTEPNEWWLVHFDPQMRAILDPEGPFMYCSVAEGHHAKLPPLPVVPAAAQLVQRDGDYHDAHASGLIVPSAPARRRKIAEFPG